MSEYNDMTHPVNLMASDLHEEWRRGYDPENKGIPRMKGDENINVPYKDLSDKWQEENKKAAIAALEAVEKYPDDRESGSSYIHDEWLKRHGSWAPEDQKVPYNMLSEEDKEKDRVHYNLMKSKLNLSGGKRMVKKSKKNSKGKGGLVKRKRSTRKNKKSRRYRRK
jgi:hypothetical protein